MGYRQTRYLLKFRQDVAIKFQLYNSLFTSLPFHRIEKTGILLSVLSSFCEDGYKAGNSPIDILENFFDRLTNASTEQERLDMLFRFIQYSERQIVLFDALEDAAVKGVNDFNGVGTLKHLESQVLQSNKTELLSKKLKNFSIRLVLTAHPTQFYPGSVLGIINDLAIALEHNNTPVINSYLQQLGRTPFFKKHKPSPYDEAVSLIWYLENVFYKASGNILSLLKENFADVVDKNNPVVRMGFWPGGDRDGNPFVTCDITLKVAQGLRGAILKCYYMEVRRLKRRLTFNQVDSLLTEMEQLLFNNFFLPEHAENISAAQLLEYLEKIKNLLIYQYNSLFIHQVNSLINKIEIFGLFFATLDIRQDASVHRKIIKEITEKKLGLPENYDSLNQLDKLAALEIANVTLTENSFEDELFNDTVKTIQAVKLIQQSNGEEGCNRYIISQCSSASDAMEVLSFFKWSGWDANGIPIDIIPLFETIDDLKSAAATLEILYNNPVYKKHLEQRDRLQTIMLGFSDGTKDGGYFMANWSIYRAKEELTAISRKYDIDIVFFDGRGGPPSRGGGKTHKFYASMGEKISNREIQLTVQGQTVSSNFGTVDAAQFNMEQLLSAGITNDLYANKQSFNDDEEALMQQMANYGYESYKQLRDHPYLTSYLSHASPLRFYSETNIGSRPAKRGGAGALSLKDLRAIPFAGSWSQLKQNVTGFYGVGSAIKKIDEAGDFNKLKELYQSSLFFKTLLDNCEMAMLKSFFPFTAYLKDHKLYGEIWQMAYDEYNLTKHYLTKLSGNNDLMEDYPVEQLSIQMREKIVMPIVTIQQYALHKLREIDAFNADAEKKSIYEKLAMRCSFGIINAGRNSA